MLINNALFGKFYHSVIIKNDIMYDFSHNIMMKFDDYIQLVNPEILIYEDKDTILNNIENLQNDRCFSQSNYANILKYAIHKQKKIKTLSINNQIL